MGTAHNRAVKGEIAKTVLMPGDPLRAKFVAETFFTDIRLVSDVRNVLAYTGMYKGREISVMASGMGMPSIGIYSYELYTQYDVENIIRIGSAGSYAEELKLYDIILADSAWSQSTFARVQNGYMDEVVYPSEKLNNKIIETAKELGKNMAIGRIHSSDVFYTEANMPTFNEFRLEKNCLCVEMEAFALFHNANVLGKNAACLLTISDSFITNEQVSAEGRQNSFTSMMEVALEATLKL
jgi:purine-nucleoside phosphorylase, family 1 (deoD)